MLLTLHEQLAHADWRNDWDFDLETATARHRQGWVFRFYAVDGKQGMMVSECLGHPLLLHPSTNADMFAQQAGEMYFDALRQRH